MGSLYCPGSKMQPPVEPGTRKAPASSAPHQCCPLVLCCIYAPLRANPHTPSVSTTRMICCWLISLPREEVHRDFSLIGAMYFGTARDILMAS